MPPGNLLWPILLRRAAHALVRDRRGNSGWAHNHAHDGTGQEAQDGADRAYLTKSRCPGLYYNTAAIIDERGNYLGKYRKHHIPHLYPGFWEKFYFTPGNLGYPVFETRFGKIGIYICYDRHFPEGARELGLNGAEIVFNPSATVAGLSEYLWKLEQPAHAVANQYFVGAINRVGTEKPWGIGEFYGQSYFCDPRGQIIKTASRDQDEVLIADLDLDMIKQRCGMFGSFTATEGRRPTRKSPRPSSFQWRNRYRGMSCPHALPNETWHCAS